MVPPRHVTIESATAWRQATRPSGVAAVLEWLPSRGSTEGRKWDEDVEIRPFVASRKQSCRLLRSFLDFYGAMSEAKVLVASYVKKSVKR